MWYSVVIISVCVHISAGALWSCTQNAQCSDVTGAVCAAGACACPGGQQVIGGRCVDLAVYHTAACVEEHQCARLFIAFECRKEGESEVGVCRCQDGFHFFHGRCWRTAGFGAPCTQDEECLDVPRDPYSLRCADTCVCAEGYYLRQRGECRKIGYAVGDRCVLDEDCQFTNGFCEFETLSCQLNTGTRISSNSTSLHSTSARSSTKSNEVISSKAGVIIYNEVTNFDVDTTFNDITIFNAVATFNKGAIFNKVTTFNAVTTFNGATIFNDVTTVNYVTTFNGVTTFNNAVAFNGVTTFFGATTFKDVTTFKGLITFHQVGSFNPRTFYNTLKFNDVSIFNNNVTTFNDVTTNVRSHGSYCPCPEPFECEFGSCVCPYGYYGLGSNSVCYAELGSPSTEEQCYGILAEVVDGICKCPANYFYEENMRDCIRVARRTTDACGNDDNCLTYGIASICGPPDDTLWGQRSCVCDTELSVWDADRQMCRLFAGVGEPCEVDSDCLAGELEIQCVIDDETGVGQCTCPEGLLTVDGLCLTTGLAIGDACQATLECTETANTACLGGQCACDSGYQQEGDFCAPIIGGTCALDDDCVIENTVCFNNTNVLTCQCIDSYIAYNETCWPVAPGHQSSCNHNIQCTETLGDNSLCVDERCVCEGGHHHRDGGCWPVTALFESCSRTSQCYLPAASERAVCRNGLCQCDFEYPYSEEDRTCASSASSIIGSTVVIISALMYLILS